MKSNSFKQSPAVRLTFSVILVLILAWLLSVPHYRFDLTAEKRYTLSDYTKNELKNLNQDIHMKVYLAGEMNIPFHKMQQRLRETLEEFRVLAGDHIRYEFINPFKGKDQEAIDHFLNELIEKGLKPTNILSGDKEGGTSEKLVIPGMLVSYKNREIPVNFLKNNPGATAEENINHSVEAFEYELMKVISSITADSTEKIAFTEGHGEFDEYQVGDIINELGWNYQVDIGKINGTPGILDAYKAVVIAGPTRPFNEKDKFVLDQYVMNGGKLLFFVDMVNASIDSISSGNASLAMIRTVNLEDLLFRYGVRINPVLIQDVQCHMIPVNVALAGNPPDFKMAPWLYSPLLQSQNRNPITRNLNMIKAEFASSLDTIEARKGIKKTVLLQTSPYSRQVAAPVMISLDEVRLTPREEDFKDRFLPVAVLLEGSFESAFRNRMLKELFPDTVLTLKENGDETSILVVADADIIRNEIRKTPRGVLRAPLGYDKYTSQTFGNKDFIMNAIRYMTGHKGLINLRSRELTIRLLDKTKLKSHRRKWVLINTVMPPLVVIIAGLLYSWFRKRRYAAV